MLNKTFMAHYWKGEIVFLDINIKFLVILV